MSGCECVLPMHVLLVYDCLFPWTVGGAERYLRAVGERLAAEGHDVTYLTLRQWDRRERPSMPGVRVAVAGPRMALYDAQSQRSALPPLVFGAGVLAHLLRHGRRYDVVHTASFPYFSLLAAALVRPLGGYRLVVDWHEVWSAAYWREYLGPVGGRIGWAVQALCARAPQRAFCFARLTAGRLREIGLRGEPTVLTGEYDRPLSTPVARPAGREVVFAGRHIPEKQVPALVRAFALVREQAPQLRLAILGDGPERAEVERLVDDLGLRDAIDVPGFVSPEEVERRIADAVCLVLPSRREGYGQVVVEASAKAVPSVVARAPDNAAVELVDDGENGYVAASASPQDLAAAILRVHAEGFALRERTARWLERNAGRVALDGSLDAVVAAYRAGR